MAVTRTRTRGSVAEISATGKGNAEKRWSAWTARAGAPRQVDRQAGGENEALPLHALMIVGRPSRGQSVTTI